MKVKAFIARDRDNELFIYFLGKPRKGEGYWIVYNREYVNLKRVLGKDLFPLVKWEDEEPTEVTIEIVGEKAQQPQEQPQEQPQTKFDPKTLKSFDKVLVKYDDIWQVEIFSHIRQSEPKGWCQCTGDFYLICIPYNGDTKHLVGTTDEAPEYYRYW